MSREDLFKKICNLAGPAITVAKADDGWPGTANVKLTDGSIVRVAIHASLVGSHARKAYELRFQNPGSRKPVEAPAGALPILLGYWEKDNQAIFVATQGASRLGREARFSILFRDSVVKEALANGWAIYTSSNQEQIFAFQPSLLPTYVELLYRGIDSTVISSTSGEIATAAIAAGLLEDETEGGKERARRAVSQVIRNSAFGQAVVTAYQKKCALCGLGAGMVQGAHIYPASAPGSLDKVWNGIALCCNHHTAFDAFKIWIDPNSYAVKFHPDLVALAKSDPIVQRFLDTTFKAMTMPSDAAAKPRAAMLEGRYKYYEERYEWV
ncbi:HNH endonuclease [Dechloromonas sp. HYN0024]|uniref:HNH endonuclease n=1 Tax=Dechloromonas sp. HYN0024 TaxID=2231055 RepID=UPI0013C357DA|nr:HNH endonuclease [Dechloromonas sp. HYN0024]